jgi:hypothetical protein
MAGINGRLWQNFCTFPYKTVRMKLKIRQSRLFTVLFVFAGITLNAQKVTPGISAEEFKKQLPGIVPGKTFFNETLSLDEKMGPFDGTWQYEFRMDTLRDITYSDNLGTKPKAGYPTAFMKFFNMSNKKFGNAVHSVILKDTLLKADRKRVGDSDTILFGAWKGKHAKMVMGIYFTGNYKKSVVSPAQNAPNAEVSRDYYVFTMRFIPNNDPALPDTWKIYPGLNIMDVAKEKPVLFPKGVGLNGQWGVEETKMGLKGKHTYAFQFDKLKWDLWDYYAGKYDQTTFNNLLRATRGIIADYTKLYGAPKIVEGTTKYRDPIKDHHYGYDVITATWDKENYIIEIVYTFMGGKGQYDLLVKVEQHMK